jgi:DeoR/GlpR family transcriptional regulator of sugar metabolism
MLTQDSIPVNRLTEEFGSLNGRCLPVLGLLKKPLYRYILFYSTIRTSTMAYNIRFEEIINILTQIRKISVQELKERLSVSEATIRKDLTLLEEMGYLVRTHGGAVLAEDKNTFDSLMSRKDAYLAEKQAIARKARELVSEGDTIYLDSGSTAVHLAREVRSMNIRVVCHSVGVINELVSAPGVSLICLGGSYRKDAGSFIGPLAHQNLKNIRIETCFVGAASFSLRGDFFSQNIIEAQLKTEVLATSDRKFVLTDSSKYNKSGFAIFARPGDFDVLITDDAFPDVKLFESIGITCLLASTAQAKRPGS